MDVISRGDYDARWRHQPRWLWRTIDVINREKKKRNFYGNAEDILRKQADSNRNIGINIQTIAALINRTMTVHVQNTIWLVSPPSSSQQQGVQANQYGNVTYNATKQ